MRKGTLLIVSALVLVLAAPGFASIEFDGKLGSELKVGKNEATDEWEVTGETGIELETVINTGGGNPVKAFVEFKPWEIYSGVDEDGEPAGFDEDGNPIGVFDRTNNPLSISPLELEIDKAWIETEGSYWNRGPVVTTRIGDVHIDWDNYVSYLDDRAGVTVDGMEIGPVTASAFYAWDADNDTRPMGLAAKAAIDGIDLEGRVIHRKDEQNFLLAAGMNVMHGVRADGLVAIDGEQRHLYRVQADAEDLIPGVKLSAAYRGAQDDFEPMYTRTHDDDDNELYDTRTGVSVGLETMQSGVAFKAGYDHPKKETTVSAATEMHGYLLSGSTKLVGSELDEAKLSVGRRFGEFDVTGEYEAAIDEDTDELEHIVKVSTRTDMFPHVTDLGLMAQVKRIGSDVTWKTGADYVAPNGISLGAEYDSAEGPAATAGVTVKF